MYRYFLSYYKGENKIQTPAGKSMKKSKTAYAQWSIVYSDIKNAKEEDATIFF